MPAIWSRSKREIPVDGRKRFRGQLLGTEGEAARIHADDAKTTKPEILLPIEEMSDAKLVLTDELVTQALRREKAAKRETRAAKREQRLRRHKPGQAGTAANQGD